MANADKRKQSLYFPEDMLKEIQHEAQRLDRSLSWIVQQGWKIARDKLKAFPASNDDPESLPDPSEDSAPEATAPPRRPRAARRSSPGPARGRCAASPCDSRRAWPG